MKIGWITWDDPDDDRPVFHTTKPWETYYFRIMMIVYAEIEE